MKKTHAVALALTLALTMPFAACSSDDGADNKKPSVLIWSGAEEYRNAAFQTALNAQFPDYDIYIEYMSTGDMAAKVVAEGANTEADIVFDLEAGNVPKVAPFLADLSGYDSSIFTDDMIIPGNKVLPETRNGGCIAINTVLLAQKGLAVPTSYEDLLKPEYKGLISMPNPHSSGTGYMFLKSLVNSWGEDQAFAYFAQLKNNILAFTSSGSGPVNALVQGEAAIGLAMTAQTVTEINKGAPLQILFFKEGSPFSLYNYGIVAGKDARPEVKAVFDYFYTTLVAEDKAAFFPEKIYKDKDFTITNYPTNIPYADMSNNTAEVKAALTARWETEIG